MQCDIYKPRDRSDLYLFVPSGVSPARHFPEILSQFGPLQFVKTREILPGQALIGANTDDVLQNIGAFGFHVQGVQIRTTEVSEGGAALGGGVLGASVAGPLGALVGAIIGLAIAEHAKKVPDEL
jgi:uncharacterized protein YcgL (UPF0745 family)